MTLRLCLMLSLIFFITSCQESRYIPSKADVLTPGFYEEFSEKLELAYDNEDDFEVGIQLANLKAPKEKVYGYLNKGIHKAPNDCLKLYPSFEALRAIGIKSNIVKIDTTEFLNSIDLCFSILGKDSYSNFLNEKELASGKAQREELDSLLFDYALIAELQQIRKDDQKIRLMMEKKDIYNDSPIYDSLINLQTMLDSINLFKIDNVLKEHGWPSKEKIGYDTGQTIWLVLHHQGDIHIRDKYQDKIEANTGPGSIEAYNWRSDNIRKDMRINSTSESP